MLWIPAAVLLASLGLSEFLRQLGRPARGLLGLVLSLAAALGCVGLVVVLIEGLDLETARQAQEWLTGGWGLHPAVLTAALALFGFALVFGGGARLVDRVALADPREPLPDTFTPGLACGLGLLLLLLALQRL